MLHINEKLEVFLKIKLIKLKTWVKTHKLVAYKTYIRPYVMVRNSRTNLYWENLV